MTASKRLKPAVRAVTADGSPPRRVALVTGGTRGFGEAIVVALAAAGMDVAVIGRDRRAGQRVCERLNEMACRGLFIEADITHRGAMDGAVASCLQVLGGLDVAVNNAGTAAAGALLTQSEADWELSLGTNLTGVWRSLRAELRVMVAQGSGAVINIASIWGLRGRAGLSAYSATKHAVIGLTKCAALEVAAAGVRVNAVCPGTSDTDMVRKLGRSNADLRALAGQYPFGRLVTGAEVAGAVRWLAGDDAGYVTGESVVVDGGFTA